MFDLGPLADLALGAAALHGLRKLRQAFEKYATNTSARIDGVERDVGDVKQRVTVLEKAA